MDGGKKTKSLIYQLFQRFNAAQSEGASSKASDVETVMGLTQQTQDSQPVPEQRTQEQPVVSGAPNLHEAGVTEDVEDHGAVPDEVSKELKYLLPVYELYLYFCAHGTALQPVRNLREFYTRLHCLLYEVPDFDGMMKQVHDFEEELSLVCAAMRAKLEPEKEQGSSDEEEENQKEIPPADATIHVKLSENKMYAVIFTTPAQDGGKQLKAEAIKAALTKEHVVFGIREEQLLRIVEEGQYMQFVIAAVGTLPVEGTDGYIEDRTDCRKTKTMQEDENGNIDYKNLDRYENIEKGQVICDLIPAVDGTNGSDVCGRLLRPATVRNPAFAGGRNTMISDNQLQILAAVSGYVSYKNDHYHVEPVLEINGNVDYSVGNIDFSGDVVIRGDVTFGFTVKAQGSITVRGMVEGAELIAEGDITIHKGMNGNNSGSLTAQGKIRASYLENCSVHAGGALYANSIISCDIFCDDAVYLDGGRGIIIGGTVTALKSVEARMIGSKSQRETTIILGETPHLVIRKKEIKTELAQMRSVIEKLKLNFNYLNRLRGTLPPDKLSVLNQLEEQCSLYEQRTRELEQKLQELVQSSTDFSHCYVNSNMIFPVTRIVIGGCNTNIDTVLSKCHVYMAESEIKIGTL